MSKQTAGVIAAFVLLCSLHLWIYANLPEARKSADWPNTVMRNWHEYGFWHLGGQLVCNPGGLDANEKPFVYPGHRPWLLVPPYLLKELPGAWGGNGLLYDFVMTLATFASLTYLFGAAVRGVLAAFVLCLCPGFIANVASIDTISYPAVTGIAALAFAGGCLARNDNRNRLQWAALIVLLLFMLMNWSTLFSLFIAAVYVGCKRPLQAKWVLYFAAALITGVAVFAVSILSRHESGATSGDFWNAYLMGPAGYDRHGMNWGKALVRISAVNVIAWLPLIVAMPALLFCNGLGARWQRALLPLLAAIFAVLAMRNYNAHHPWGAVSMIGLGLVFSVELLIAPDQSAKSAVRSAVMIAAAAFSLLYCTAWLALDEFNKREERALYELVAMNTPRHGLIVVADRLLPEQDLEMRGFSGSLDRKSVTMDEWEKNRAEIERSGKEVFFLAHAAVPPGTHLIAQSDCRAHWADKIMVPMFDFYRSKISRRAPGDREVYFDEYHLYKF
jgi:hypothetical protein